jgi:hypothetical protein
MYGASVYSQTQNRIVLLMDEERHRHGPENISPRNLSACSNFGGKPESHGNKPQGSQVLTHTLESYSKPSKIKQARWAVNYVEMYRNAICRWTQPANPTNTNDPLSGWDSSADIVLPLHGINQISKKKRPVQHKTVCSQLPRQFGREGPLLLMVLVMYRYKATTEWIKSDLETIRGYLV